MSSKIIKKYHAAWASKNSTALAGLMSSDVIFYDMAHGLKLNINQMDSYLNSLYDFCPNLKFIHVESAVCSEGIQLLRWELRRENNRGRKYGIHLPGVEIIHIKREKIYQVECYYDSETETNLKYSKPSNTINKKNTIKPKYIKARLAPRLLSFYYRNLEQVMVNEKPFLDPDLTLSELAKTLGLTTNNLSQVINRQLGINFNTFMNRYRTEVAKQILKEESHKSVIDIAFQSGFNSVSAFYLAFKNHIGMTPSEFKKLVNI